MGIKEVLGFTRQSGKVFLDLDNNKRFNDGDVRIKDKNADQIVNIKDIKLTLMELAQKKRSPIEEVAWQNVQKKIKVYQNEIVSRLNKLSSEINKIEIRDKKYRLEIYGARGQDMLSNRKSTDHVFFISMTDLRGMDYYRIFDFSFVLSLREETFLLPWKIPKKKPIYLKFDNKLDMQNFYTFITNNQKKSLGRDEFDAGQKISKENSPKVVLRYLVYKLKKLNKNNYQIRQVINEMQKLLDSYFIPSKSIDLEDEKIFPKNVKDGLYSVLNKYKKDLYGKVALAKGFKVPRYITAKVFSKMTKHSFARSESFIVLIPLLIQPDYKDQAVNFIRTIESILPEKDFKNFLKYKNTNFEFFRKVIENKF